MTARFSPVFCSDCNTVEMIEEVEGDFVFYSDYETLLLSLRHILKHSANVFSAREQAEGALASLGEI